MDLMKNRFLCWRARSLDAIYPVSIQYA